MQINTVIFDMDGVLIDSEPYWEEAGSETLAEYGIFLEQAEYHSTTGLRTREWIDWWFTRHGVDKKFSEEAEYSIVSKAIEKIDQHALPMKGVDYIFKFFVERNFTIGLATSSPVALVEVVAKKLGIKQHLKAFSSAELLAFGKPHPQVYLDCAEQLGVSPLSCLCFEDSFNGMIAAKAARMKCIVIPHPMQYTDPKWGSADAKLSALSDFNETVYGDIT